MDTIYNAYIDTINESLTSPYKWRWKKINVKDESIVIFNTNTNSEPITVKITNDNGIHNIVFYVLTTSNGASDPYNSYNATNANDPFKIFSTVIDIILDFINKNSKNIEQISFSAKKTRYQKNSRTSLYEKFVKKYFNIPGWVIKKTNKTHRLYFDIYNKNYVA